MYTKADFCEYSKQGTNGYMRCPRDCAGPCYHAIEKLQEYLKGEQRSRQHVSTKNINVRKTTKKRYK